MTKSRTLSLNAFHRAIPGPIGSALDQLPSKPGQVSRANDVGKELNDIASLSIKGGRGAHVHQGSNYASGPAQPGLSGKQQGLGLYGCPDALGSPRDVGEWSTRHVFDHEAGRNGSFCSSRDGECAYPLRVPYHDAGYGASGVLVPPPPPPPPPRHQQQLQQQADIIHPGMHGHNIGARGNVAVTYDKSPRMQQLGFDTRDGHMRQQASIKETPPLPGHQHPQYTKNEWADKMAQATMAKLTTGGIKSSLLAGGDSGIAATPLAAHSVVAKAAATPLMVDPAVPVDPLQAEEKAADAEQCRLNLLPRTRPLTVPDAVQPVLPSASADTSTNGSRPKLMLLPRSKPPAGSSPDPQPGSVAKSGAKASIFGDARPREEVLKERGVDPALTVARMEHAEYNLHGAEPYARHNSRPASVHSGFSDEGTGAEQWHVVGGGRPKMSVGRADRGHGAYDDVDPFFGGGSNSARPWRYNTPGHDGHGVYGTHGSPGLEDDDGGPMFKRSLPTRTDLF